MKWLTTNQGGCEEEIRRLLAKFRTAATKLTNIKKDRDITSTHTNMNFFNCHVCGRNMYY